MGGGTMIIANKKFKASSINFPSFFLIEAVACTFDWNNEKLALIGIYAPGYDWQVQSMELNQILHHVSSTLHIQKVILLGDFNLPTLHWEYDYSDTSIIEELCIKSDEFNIDNAFATSIIDKGFIQKNYISNDNGTFLDLIFINFDMEIKVHRPSGPHLIDNESNHHPAFIFQLMSTGS